MKTQVIIKQVEYLEEQAQKQQQLQSQRPKQGFLANLFSCQAGEPALGQKLLAHQEEFSLARRSWRPEWASFTE